MREVAEQHGLGVLSPADVNDEAAQGELASLRPDLFVVCDYGQILSAQTLAVAPQGGINLHGSLLPRYRGAAPVNWAVITGDTETGVTVIHMTPRLDAGPCLARSATAIDPDETAEELEPRLAELGVRAVEQALDLLAGWDGVAPVGDAQDATQVSRAPRLKKADGRVDWSRSAEQIRNQVRGLKPWPGTFTSLSRASGEPLRLLLEDVSVVETEGRQEPPGTILACDSRRLIVAAGQGGLSLDRVQPAGKRVMDIAEFLRGHRLQVGDRLGD
jgi:methionyl-tRNA formyltransferase